MKYTLLLGHNISDGIGDAMHLLRILQWYNKKLLNNQDLPTPLAYLSISDCKNTAVLAQAKEMGILIPDNLDGNSGKTIIRITPEFECLDIETFLADLALKIDDVTSGFELSTIRASGLLLQHKDSPQAQQIIAKLSELAEEDAFHRFLEFNSANTYYQSVEKSFEQYGYYEFAGSNFNVSDYMKANKDNSFAPSNKIKAMGVGYEGISGLENTGIPLELVKSDKAQALATLDNGGLLEIFKKTGYNRESANEQDFLQATLIVPCYLQSPNGYTENYMEYFSVIISSPLAKNYKNIIFVTNKHSSYEEELKSIAGDYSDHNVFIYQDYFNGDTYIKILTIAQGFAICSGDNSFINALNHGLFPILIDNNHKTYQLAIMLEYLKQQDLFDQLPTLANWLGKWHGLEPVELEDNLWAKKTDPFIKLFQARSDLQDKQEKYKEMKIILKQAESNGFSCETLLMEEVNRIEKKQCEESVYAAESSDLVEIFKYLKRAHKMLENAKQYLFTQTTKCQLLENELGEFGSITSMAKLMLIYYALDLTQDLVEEWKAFVSHVDENANLFDSIEHIVLVANGIEPYILGEVFQDLYTDV
jgi:hypothetical protein